MVFVAVGFETTAPATAVVVKQAANESIDNFCILSNHKLVVPAMQALLSDKNNRIDAFLCPGHVSVIIGYAAFREIVEQYRRPCVVAGFEPMQIIEGLAEICRQLSEGKPEAKSIYTAVVTEQGNVTGAKRHRRVFRAGGWLLERTGKNRKEHAEAQRQIQQIRRDETLRHNRNAARRHTGCRCGEVLCGLIDPPDCELFGKTCTRKTPSAPVWSAPKAPAPPGSNTVGGKNEA